MRADEEREDCSPSKTKIISYRTMPEVQRFDNIMRRIDKDRCLMKIKGRFVILILLSPQERALTLHIHADLIIEAESRLSLARRFGLQIKASTPTNLDLTSADSTYNTVMRRINAVIEMSQNLKRQTLGMSLIKLIAMKAESPSHESK